MVLSTLGGCIALSACQDDSSSSGTGSVAVCQMTDNVGEPDILAQPKFSPTTVYAGDSVMVSVPIDHDTFYISAYFFNNDPQTASLAAFGAVTNELDQATIEYEMSVDANTPAGTYYPSFSLCMEIDFCEPVVYFKSTDNTAAGAAGATASYSRENFLNFDQSNETCLQTTAIVVKAR